LKTVAISQSNYLPWKGYFDMINSVDEFIIYDDMQFTKRDWRNRNTIKTPNGLLWLTIPVKVKGKFFQKINETEIDGNNWAEKHWKTIQMNYAKAPCFKQFEDKLQKTFEIAASKTFLSDVNSLFLTNLCEILNISTPMRFSSEFILKEGKTERLLDLCKQVGATRYVSGPAAKSYIDADLFSGENIELFWMNYTGYPVYRQSYGAFEHSVSVLDVIFNLGDEARTVLKSFGGIAYE
jgi:hypothetical protein